MLFMLKVKLKKMLVISLVWFGISFCVKIMMVGKVEVRISLIIIISMFVVVSFV